MTDPVGAARTGYLVPRCLVKGRDELGAVSTDSRADDHRGLLLAEILVRDQRIDLCDGVKSDAEIGAERLSQAEQLAVAPAAGEGGATDASGPQRREEYLVLGVVGVCRRGVGWS